MRKKIPFVFTHCIIKTIFFLTLASRSLTLKYVFDDYAGGSSNYLTGLDFSINRKETESR